MKTSVLAEFNLASAEAIFCDVDGVMVDHGEQIPPADLIEEVRRVNEKTPFIPVTGRSLQDGLEFLSALPIDTAIAAGGAIKLGRVPDEPQYFERGQLVPIVVIPTLMPAGILRLFLDKSGEETTSLVIEEVSEALQPTEAESMFIRSIPHDEAKMWADRINSILGDRLHAVPTVSQSGLSYDVQINRNIASKVNALRRLSIGHELRRVVDLSKSIYIGDGLNDGEAVQEAAYGVAMGNAHPTLKEVADEVIGSQQDGGLIDFLKRF